MSKHDEFQTQSGGEGAAVTSHCPEATPEKRKPLNNVHWLVLVGLVFFSYFAFSRVGVQVVEVMGESMSPTMHATDHYLLKKWVYLLRAPQRNEVVVIADPDDDGFSVKRIVATEGETVALKDGKVFVDGKELAEPYLPPGVATFGHTRSGEQVFRCGKGEYFLLGDNRPISLDSRTYGPVPRQNILGLILP